MAYGMELVIGWQHKDWKIPLAAHNLEVLQDPPQTIEIKESAQATEVNRLLRQAHLAAVKEMGWTVVGEKDELVSVVTPLGPRELQPFELSVYYDPDVGGPETALLCVALSKRYRPCFLDWKERYGTLKSVVFDEDMLRMMDLAKNHILTVLPAFETASWLYVEYMTYFGSE